MAVVKVEGSGCGDGEREKKGKGGERGGRRRMRGREVREYVCMLPG